jgi:hypothetical protein
MGNLSGVVFGATLDVVDVLFCILIIVSSVTPSVLSNIFDEVHPVHTRLTST